MLFWVFSNNCAAPPDAGPSGGIAQRTISEATKEENFTPFTPSFPGGTSEGGTKAEATRNLRVANVQAVRFMRDF